MTSHLSCGPLLGMDRVKYVLDDLAMLNALNVQIVTNFINRFLGSFVDVFNLILLHQSGFFVRMM